MERVRRSIGQRSTLIIANTLSSSVHDGLLHAIILDRAEARRGDVCGTYGTRPARDFSMTGILCTVLQSCLTNVVVAN